MSIAKSYDAAMLGGALYMIITSTLSEEDIIILGFHDKDGRILTNTKYIMICFDDMQSQQLQDKLFINKNKLQVRQIS
jgi:hypothetical protein